MTEGKRPGKVLVVDDDLVMLSTLGAVLGEQFEVRLARGVEEGTRALEKDPYEVLITDYELADGTGRQLLKVASERYPGLYTILLTGRSDSAEVRSMQRAGVLVLFKPIDPEGLTKWVSNGVAMARLEASTRASKARAEARKTARLGDADKDAR